jgi:Ca2+-binding EF-hand superfamily protein
VYAADHEIKEIKGFVHDTFNKYDTDGSGTLDKAELKLFLDELKLRKSLSQIPQLQPELAPIEIHVSEGREEV